MSLIKNRNKNKWILPKNNHDLIRHRLYVSFVIEYLMAHDKFPSIEQYKNEIVDYLVGFGANQKGKKTADYHQLYQPVFFNMLAIEDGVVVPTKLGIAFANDAYGRDQSDIIFSLFYDISFKTGATSTSKEFDDVKPIKILIDNLIKYKKISFDELNGKFYYSESDIDIKNVTMNKDKNPSWVYILIILEMSNLIKSNTNINRVSMSRTDYKKDGEIYPTQKLIDLVKGQSATQKDFSDNILEYTNTTEYAKKIYGSKNNSAQRDSTKQSIYRNKLLFKHKKCQMCKIKNEALLVASHIKPYSKSLFTEKFDTENGLVLCVLHDKLFDRGLITFSEGKILISDYINDEWKNIMNTIDAYPFLSDKNKKYMEYHIAQVFKGGTKTMVLE